MELRKLKIALFATIYILVIVWTVFFVQKLLNVDLTSWGILPREWKTVGNFLISPLLHANLEHLFNNSLAFFILSTFAFYFYGGIALRVILGGVFSGVLVWIFGRDSYHIGLSGVVYCLAAFLFTSGIIRKNISLMAVSLLVVFIQSEMIWGLFPSLNEPLQISWEGHLSGAAVGFVMAFIYRKRGPKNDTVMEDDDDEAISDSDGGNPNNLESDEAEKIQ